MIQIENLSFQYTKKQLLFEDLSLGLKPGNIYGLLGQNGAGKTTLLKIISGLLFPTHGKIEVNGFRPGNRYPRFLREVFFVAEEFDLPPIDMESFIRLYSPFYPRFNQELLDHYLTEFRLPRDQRLSIMSYGQKKKFLLSFALATDCRLVIMDEPTNGLDIPSKSLFRKAIANAVHEERSFIISTHQVRDMESIIDPVIILDEGKIVFHENIEQISKKLSIARQTDIPGKDVMYYEPSLNGYTVVKENKGPEETKVNLELVFNAVLGNREKINQIFKSQSHETVR
jgi:ABC-2 type transport system ATP-binding protein